MVVQQVSLAWRDSERGPSARFARPYTGRIISFGEYVFGLTRPDGVKNRSLWTGGIWVGKDVKDMGIVAAKEAVFTTRSVRRTQPAWRKDEVLALTGSPWSSKGPKVKAGHLAPLPGSGKNLYIG